MVYGQSGEFATGGHDDVVLHLSSWQFVGTHTLDDLVQILAEDRLEETEIADRATVETGAGEAERLHYWWADSGDVYSTVEFVFFALDGQAYTLSMLTAEPIADQMWPIFSRIGASLHPLD